MSKKVKVNNFTPPVVDTGKAPMNCKVVGIKEGSAKREVLFESIDYDEFLKAYTYHYKSGKYIAVFKEYEEGEQDDS